ncbi:uncharacterized protein LOC135205139 [Macrobrachium nipponense]|uniref:uncharacterized protein LOC135205139 n=1 Tax=Macrobrachium nipponense TaxID=159736 RepID=UPI0030C85506
MKLDQATYLHSKVFEIGSVLIFVCGGEVFVSVAWGNFDHCLNINCQPLPLHSTLSLQKDLMHLPETALHCPTNEVHKNGCIKNNKSESIPEVSQRFKGKLQLNKRLSLVGAADEATSSRSADSDLRGFVAVSEAEAAGSGGEDVDDVLPAPVRSLEVLDDSCTKLTDETFKKKLTLYLSSLGGHSLGDTVHRIKKLGSNIVWSS